MARSARGSYQREAQQPTRPNANAHRSTLRCAMRGRTHSQNYTNKNPEGLKNQQLLNHRQNDSAIGLRGHAI